MSSSRSTLSGRRGWSAVVGLTTVLTVLVAGQLPAASAQDRPLAPVASALSVLVPSLAPSPASVPELLPAVAPAPGPVAAQERPVTTSAADRLSVVAARAASDKAAAAQAAADKAAAAAKAAAAKAAADKTAADRAAAAQAAVAKAAAAKAAGPALCSGDGWQERRGRAALASLKAGAERTGFRVEFSGARKGYLGLTHLQQRRIEMFVRACGTQSDELLRHVMAHELGHAYDTTHGNATIRAAWQAVRGIPASTPWYGCSGCTDFATPAGDFAEVYAQWARGSSTNRSELAGDVGGAQLAQLAQQFFGA